MIGDFQVYKLLQDTPLLYWGEGGKLITSCEHCGIAIRFTNDDYIRIGNLLADTLITLILCPKCALNRVPQHEEDFGVAVGAIISSD